MCLATTSGSTPPIVQWQTHAPPTYKRHHQGSLSRRVTVSRAIRITVFVNNQLSAISNGFIDFVDKCANLITSEMFSRKIDHGGPHKRRLSENNVIAIHDQRQVNPRGIIAVVMNRYRRNARQSLSLFVIDHDGAAPQAIAGRLIDVELHELTFLDLRRLARQALSRLADLGPHVVLDAVQHLAL